MHAKALWKRLIGTLRHLIGLHNVDSKEIIYGYNPSTSTAEQLANYLLVLGKSTIYKTYMQQMQNADYHPITNM
jgi:ABC-type transport system involved in cytochrome c biogenesis ATPase subunit